MDSSTNSKPTRKVSKVLTIEDIINARPAGGSSQDRPKSRILQTNENSFDGGVNPATTSNNFVRFNHNRVIITPSVGVIPENSVPDNNGHVNRGYTGGSTNTLRTGSTPSVYVEQYWSWSCTCRNNWSKREKKLLIGLGVAALIICGLVIVISVFAKENHFRPSSWIGLNF